jgi:hypothetical protein
MRLGVGIQREGTCTSALSPNHFHSHPTALTMMVSSAGFGLLRLGASYKSSRLESCPFMARSRPRSATKTAILCRHNTTQHNEEAAEGFKLPRWASILHRHQQPATQYAGTHPSTIHSGMKSRNRGTWWPSAFAANAGTRDSPSTNAICNARTHKSINYTTLRRGPGVVECRQGGHPVLLLGSNRPRHRMSAHSPLAYTHASRACTYSRQDCVC